MDTNYARELLIRNVMAHGMFAVDTHSKATIEFPPGEDGQRGAVLRALRPLLRLSGMASAVIAGGASPALRYVVFGDGWVDVREDADGAHVVLPSDGLCHVLQPASKLRPSIVGSADENSGNWVSGRHVYAGPFRVSVGCTTWQHGDVKRLLEDVVEPASRAGFTNVVARLLGLRIGAFTVPAAKEYPSVLCDVSLDAYLSFFVDGYRYGISSEVVRKAEVASRPPEPFHVDGLYDAT